MAEKLTAAAVKTIQKKDGSGSFWVVTFVGGREATVFHATAVEKIEKECIGKELEYELKPPNKEGYSPIITKIEGIWEEQRRASRPSGPLMTDEQIDKIVGGLQYIGDRLANAIDRMGTVKKRLVQTETGAEQVALDTSPRDVSEDEVLDESGQVHPRCEKSYEGRRCTLVATHWGDHSWEGAA